MLSLCELERAARILESRFRGQRLQAAVQPDPLSLALTLYGGDDGERGRRRHLLLSARPDSARVSELAEAARAAPGGRPALAQYLRAHAGAARLRAARLWHEDRVLALRLEAAGGALELVLQIMGPRSNLYLLDAEGRIAACARPLAETRPELRAGGPWQPAASRPPRRGEDRFEPVEDGDFLRTLEEHYAEAEQHSAQESLERKVEGALRKRRRGLERKLERLERELADAQRDTGLERQGELLKGALSRVRKGEREVVVRDYETGEPVEIALDPERSPAENLERLFKRYRKAVRTLTRGGAQEQALRGALAAHAQEEAAFEALGPGELAAFAERPALRELLDRPAQPPPRRAQGAGAAELKLAGRRVPARLAPRRYRTADGLEVWVGRNDEANDLLSTRLASGKDLFFHLDGAPGSHVVLRTGGRSDPPPESLLDACELAVHFSKARKAGRADVHVVPIQNVKKPRGAKPGLVTVHGGRSIHLRREPARLERMLSSRIDGEG